MLVCQRRALETIEKIVTGILVVESGRRWSRTGRADSSCHRLRALNLIRRTGWSGIAAVPGGRGVVT